MMNEKSLSRIPVPIFPPAACPICFSSFFMPISYYRGWNRFRGSMIE